MDNDDKTYEILKQREIDRLTTPLQTKRFKKYDIEGNQIQKDFRGNYIIEPKKGILTDDEILIYAGESKAASKIRLKRGNGDFSDKTNLNGQNLFIIEFIVVLVAFYVILWAEIDGNLIAKVISILFVLFLIIFPIYILFIKDYKDPNYKEIMPNIQNHTDIQSNKSSISSIYDVRLNELKNLYEVKVKIAEELVEKRFEPPQLTYDKFMSAIDSCTDLFYNQYGIMENLIETKAGDSVKIDYEIEHRIKILKSLIETIDNLTNELVINISQVNSKDDDEINNMLKDMNLLIDSIKEYK